MNSDTTAPQGGGVDGFDQWHDAKWPKPADTDPYHWRVLWDDRKRRRREAWEAALATQPRTDAAQQGQAVDGCPHCGGTRGHWEGCRAPVDAQPAAVPVGVGRKHPDDGNGDDDAYNRGWNDCLDALAQQQGGAK